MMVVVEVSSINTRRAGSNPALTSNIGAREPILRALAPPLAGFFEAAAMATEEPPYAPRLPVIRRLRIAATIPLNVKSGCSATRSKQPSNAFRVERCCRRLALMQSYQSPRRLSLPFPTVRERPHPRLHRQRAAFMIPRRRSTSKSFIAPTSQTGGSPRRALGSGPSKLRERPPPHLRDPHAGDFHRASTCDHALGPCSRRPGADEINQEIDREPVREHDRLLAAAVGGCGEQFERAAALGLRAAPAA